SNTSTTPLNTSFNKSYMDVKYRACRAFKTHMDKYQKMHSCSNTAATPDTRGGMGHYVHNVHIGLNMASCTWWQLNDNQLFNFFEKIKRVEQAMDMEKNKGALLLDHYFGDTKFIEAVKWTVHKSGNSSVVASTIVMSLNTLAAEPHMSFDNNVSEAFIREKSIVNILRDIVKVWKVLYLVDPKCLDDLYTSCYKYHKYKLEDFILESCQFKEKGDNEAKEMSERMMEMHSARKKVITKAIECDISVCHLVLKFLRNFIRRYGKD
ncbi:hypothetical protein Tco_1396408, partial [Tanacetum coccineum]